MDPRPRKGLAHREIDGSVYIVDAAGRRLHRLNDTGSLIWKVLSLGGSAERAAKALADEFDVDARTAAADVASFTRSLEKEGLVERGSR